MKLKDLERSSNKNLYLLAAEMVAAHKARQIEGLAGGCARSMMTAKSYCTEVLLLYLPFTMPYITHGFLRADSRNSMGFILLYGKKNVSRYGFRHSVLEATRRPVCHVIMQRCAGRDMLDDAAAEAQLAEADELLTAVLFVPMGGKFFRFLVIVKVFAGFWLRTRKKMV